MTATFSRTEATTEVAHVVTLHEIGSRSFRHIIVWDCDSDDEAREFVQENLARPRERVSLIYCPSRTIRKRY